MIKEILLQILPESKTDIDIDCLENVGSSIDIDTIDDFGFIRDYTEEHNLELRQFLANLALLERHLQMSMANEDYFWKNRYEIGFLLRELLGGEHQSLIHEPPELLVECTDITRRCLELLLKYAHWVENKNKVSEDENFFFMLGDLLYAFYLILANDDSSYTRNCFQILKYTLETLNKKANESEANDSEGNDNEGNDSPGDL